VARVPLSDAARQVLNAEPALIETVLTGGDDYEVLASVPLDQLAAFERTAAAVGVAVTAIGDAVAGDGEARFVGRDGRPLVFARSSFSHF
jgi:thiamine-monophosphate kinase